MNILFTSVGRRGYLIRYFKKELKNEGMVHAANSELDVSGLIPADIKVQTPLIFSKDYIPFLLEYCKRNEIKALIPLFDLDLPKLSKHKKEFREIGVQVIVSDPDVVEICRDKWKLHHFLKQHKFSVKQAFVKKSDVYQSIKKGESEFPLFLKPRRGMGSIGVHQVNNSDELDTSYDIILKKISETYLKYESAIEDAPILIQEACEGDEYNLDVINDLGKNYRTTIVKKKIRMRCGETECAVTVNHGMLQQLGELVGNTLKHIGNLDIDLIIENGKPYIIDMNARFGGGYPFSHLAGANLPAEIILWLKGGRSSKNLLNIKYGVKGIKDIVIRKV